MGNRFAYDGWQLAARADAGGEQVEISDRSGAKGAQAARGRC